MSYNIFSIAKIDRIKCVVQKFNFPYALIKGDALSLQIYGCCDTIDG